MLRLTLVLSLVALQGCGEAPAAGSRRTPKDRQDAAEVKLSRTPVPRSYRFDGNELKVIEVPVKDSDGFVDMQRCFVWRDQEFKSATLSCGQQPDIQLADPHAGAR